MALRATSKYLLSCNFKTFRSFCSKRSFCKKSSKILGIETSCDDTGCAIVNTEGKILGEYLASQQEIHSQLGGIIPPIAQELHLKNMDIVVSEALKSGGMVATDIDAVAVTVKPGLALSLQVGVTCAKSLSTTIKKPIIPIHHMEAHALTIRMLDKVKFPFLVLLISGGHCLIAVAEDVDKFLLLGKTLDDAPGEAFDKIARRLKIWNMEGFDGLSGGKAMEILSKRGDALAFPISEPLLHSNDCNFSFAGIKNSARQFILEEEKNHDIQGGEILPSLSDLCASVQFAITKHLCRRIQRAMTFVEQRTLIPKNQQALVVSGGVASNSTIREGLLRVCNEMDYSFHAPPPRLCTDNGVMIAWNGVEKWTAGIDVISYHQAHTIDFQPKATFGADISEEVRRSGIRCRWVKSIFSKNVSLSS